MIGKQAHPQDDGDEREYDSTDFPAYGRRLFLGNRPGIFCLLTQFLAILYAGLYTGMMIGKIKGLLSRTL